MSNRLPIIPPRLTPTSRVRVVAPSRTIQIISGQVRATAIARLTALGFSVSFGRNVEACDEFMTSHVSGRLSDLHDAFADKEVDVVLTVIGGYSSNQLLAGLDYDSFASNPKIVCGFSDITILANALNAKTGVITYVGPHFSSWGMEQGFDYSKELFLQCCGTEAPFELHPSGAWSDDPWYEDQINRRFLASDGLWCIRPGEAKGRLVGGHLRSFSSLQGTEYWPGLDDTILVIEEDASTIAQGFDRYLQSLLLQRDFSGVRGIIIGRFQRKSQITRDILTRIVSAKPQLSRLPVVANADIGHTTPQATWPIGGIVSIFSAPTDVRIVFEKH